MLGNLYAADLGLASAGPRRAPGAHSGRAWAGVRAGGAIGRDGRGCAASVGDAAQRTRSAPCIEIRLAGAVMRVPVETDGTLLTEVLGAIRTSVA